MTITLINTSRKSDSVPEQMIEKIRKNILPQWKVCFISALVVGVVAHLYKITNWLPNWDSVVFRYDAQNMLNLGRWFLSIVCAPGSFYDLPWITGLLAIIFHALGAVCILKIFNVKKFITSALVGALIVSFPTVTSVMLYNYVADGYSIAFFLSVVAAMLLTKDKPRYIFSAILIALSCGIYQAYVTVTIVLLNLYIIFELLYNCADIKRTIIKCFKWLLTGVLGMALYYLILNVLLFITGSALSEYQGVDSAMSFGSINIMNSIYAVKQTFFCYFFDFSNGINSFSIINCIIFLFTLLFSVISIIKNKLNFAKILTLFIFTVLLPFGAIVLVFINCNMDYHNLMKMGFVVFYLPFVLMYEKSDFKPTKLNLAKSWVIFCVTLILVFNQIIIANVSYHKLNMAYQKSYGILVRIADRIEQTEGTDNCDKLLLIGALPESEAYSVNLPPDITGTTDGYILREDDEIVGQSVLTSALNDYCGKKFDFVSGVEKTELLEKIDIDNLKSWPEKDSIFIIDNVIVIKLGG